MSQINAVFLLSIYLQDPEIMLPFHRNNKQHNCFQQWH